MTAPCVTTPSKFQLRRDTAAQWASINPKLSAGEPGVETDTGQMKVGDGTKLWNALPYVGSGAFYTYYLLDPPPAPLGLTIDSTNSSQYINVYWQYPTQINAGFYTTGWLPDIISFSTQLEGVTYGGAAGQTHLLSTPDSHFVDPHDGTPTIVVLRLIPFVYSSGPIGYSSSVTTSGGTFPGYIIYDSNFASMTDGAGVIRIWYNNYNTTTSLSSYSSTAGPLTFNLAHGPPTPPAWVSAVDNGLASGGKRSELVTFTKSDYANSSNYSDTTATISNYAYTYTYQSSVSRYTSAPTISDSGTIAITTVPPSTTTFSNSVSLYSGAVYSLSLTSTNSYGLTCAPVVLSPNIQTNWPAVPASTAFSMSSRYYPTAVKISDSSVVTNLLSNYTLWSNSTPFIKQIHDGSTRGQGTVSVPLVYSITGSGLTGSPTFPTVTFDGFAASAPGYVVTGSTAVIDPLATVVDAYADNPSKYFYLVGSNTFTINLASNFTNANTPYTITVSPDSSPFYYDKITGVPTVTPTIGLNTSPSNISGLLVYGSYDSFSNTLVCTNMGDYFCPSVLGYSQIALATTGVVVGTHTPNAQPLYLSDVTAGSISGGAFTSTVTLSYTDTETLDAYALATASINGTVYNLVGSNTFDSSGTSTLKMLIDNPSLTLNASLPSSLPTVGTTNAFVVGRLISSGSSFNATTYAPAWYGATTDTSYGSIAYDHTAGLTSNYELILANGKFRTWGSTSYYQDYRAYTTNISDSNYSTISHSSTDYRFITFAWTINTTTGFSFNTIAFKFSNVGASTLSFDTNGTAYITGTSPKVYPLLYYRFEEQLYTTTDYRIPQGLTSITETGNPNYTSDWVNMNSVPNPVNSANYNNLTSTSGSPYVKGGFTNAVVDGTGTIYTFTPSIMRSGQITASTFLYCRVGIPMNVTFEFASISANLYVS